MFKANRIFPICALLAAIPVFLAGQAATPMEQHTDKNVEGAQPAAKSGQETGSPHPVQLDAQHRPITAGGFVQSVMQNVAGFLNSVASGTAVGIAVVLALLYLAKTRWGK